MLAGSGARGKEGDDGTTLDASLACAATAGWACARVRGRGSLLHKCRFWCAFGGWQDCCHGQLDRVGGACEQRSELHLPTRAVDLLHGRECQFFPGSDVPTSLLAR